MSLHKLVACHLSILFFTGYAAPVAFAGSQAATSLNPLGAELVASGPVVAADGRARGTYSVPLRLRVPWERITLEEDGDELRGELRLVVAARDHKGRDEDAREILLSLRVAKEKLDAATAKPFLEYDLAMELRSGKHLVALALRDELAATMSYYKSSLKVAKPSRRVHMRYTLPQRTPLGGLALYDSSIYH